jgi:hypothetical protein
MRNVIARWKNHGEHELSNDGWKNLQRLEKPRDNRLTLTCASASLRRTGLCREVTRPPERCRQQFL